MSEDGVGLQVRQTPRKRPGGLSVADFTMLVRVPGKPAAEVRVYTDDERDEAARYAAESGGVIVPLLHSPPADCKSGPDGTPGVDGGSA